MARYDSASDSALVPPHHSEVWSRMRELDYQPHEGALDEHSFAVGRIVRELVQPGPLGDPYFEGWEEVRAALEAARYPLTHIAFSSSYGSGEVIGLWLASSGSVFREAPSIEQVLVRRLGEVRAEALRARRAACVSSRQEVEIERRADLDSPELPIKGPPDGG